MKKIPMLEKFAARSLVEHGGELIFSKEKFAELIVRECVTKMALEIMDNSWIDDAVKNTYKHFGVE